MAEEQTTETMFAANIDDGGEMLVGLELEDSHHPGPQNERSDGRKRTVNKKQKPDTKVWTVP